MGATKPNQPGQLRLAAETPSRADAAADPHRTEAEFGRHVARLLRRLARQIEECEAGTRAGDDADALHDMRVASRRLRAALRVFHDVLPHRRLGRLEKRARRLTRALGLPREWDVLRDTLARLRGEHAGDVEKMAVEHALEWIDQHRSLARRRMLRGLDRIDIERLARGVRRLADRAEQRIAVDDLCGLARRQVEPLVDAAMQEIDARRARELIEPLHETRIAIKRLRYVVELLEPAFPGPHADLLARLKNLQELLGHHHDCAVLSERLDRMIGGLEERGRTILADGLRETLTRVRAAQAAMFEQFVLATDGLSAESLRAEVARSLSDNS